MTHVGIESFSTKCESLEQPFPVRAMAALCSVHRDRVIATSILMEMSY